MKAVVFGAGAVGLGFLGEALMRSGCSTVFVDVDAAVVAALNTYGAYIFHKAGEGLQRVRVSRVRAVCPGGPGAREDLAAHLREADVAFTAAGAAALPTVGKLLAYCLASGRRSSGPLNVFCCENHPDAAQALRGATRAAMPEPASLGERARFVNTVVARMCQRLTRAQRGLPPIVPGSDVVIVAEDYDPLPVDASAVAEPRPTVHGMAFLAPEEFEAWDRRKVFAHNGVHALLAVLGRLKGCRYLYEAGRDPQIQALARGALQEELNPALLRAYPRWFSPEGQSRFAQDILTRILNPHFADTVERGLRGSLRMVGPEDGRLIRAIHFVVGHGIVPRRLCIAAAGILHLNDIPHERAVKLAQAVEPGLGGSVVALLLAAREAIAAWQGGDRGALTKFAAGS
jgi:mannitol-1-phosphate 5-dehydrogenase